MWCGSPGVGRSFLNCMPQGPSASLVWAESDRSQCESQEAAAVSQVGDSVRQGQSGQGADSGDTLEVEWPGLANSISAQKKEC